MVGVLRARVGGPAGSWVDLGSIGPQGPKGDPADTSLHNWNAEWGVQVIKRGMAKELPETASSGKLDIPASGVIGVTFSEPFAYVEGRRYRLSYFCRAWGVNGGGGGACAAQIQPWVDGVSKVSAMSDCWVQKGVLSWTDFFVEWIVNCGVGAATYDFTPGMHNFQVVASVDANGTHNFWQGGSYFAIEDIGPISGAYPVTPPVSSSSWTPLGITWPVAHNVSYRKVNDEVQFRGAMNWNITGVANPCVIMPADCRPPISVRFQTWLLAPGDQWSILAGNQLSILVPPGGGVGIGGLTATQGFVAFDQVRYSVTP
jgi:hypothetical protein